jgi:hypothetical protein
MWSSRAPRQYILFFVIISAYTISRRMPLTKKSGHRHHIKGKRTRGKRSAPRKRSTRRKRARKSNKKRRSAPHKRRRHTRSMRGRHGSMRGGSSASVPSPWIPSDLTNIYRSGVGGIMDTSNAMNGLESDPSPLPYKGQLVGDVNMVGEILRMA